jgi:hypothetical protein
MKARATRRGLGELIAADGFLLVIAWLKVDQSYVDVLYTK